MKTTADILRAAATRVRQGWCQHVLFDRRGGVCALGAVAWAHGARSTDEVFRLPDSWQDDVTALSTTLRVHGVNIVDWNNAREQTAENVAAGLEYAALVWEQEQQAIGVASDVVTTSDLQARNP